MEQQICAVCKKEIATIKVAKLVRGQVREVWLCVRCASRRWMKRPGKIEGLLAALIEKDPDRGARPSTREERQCPTCGLPLRSYRETLFLGCSDCYNAFEDVLTKDVRRYHGAAEHVGRGPESHAASEDPYLAIRDLQRRLEVAVRREDFEQAARLRDEILRLKAQIEQSHSSGSGTSS